MVWWAIAQPKNLAADLSKNSLRIISIFADIKMRNSAKIAVKVIVGETLYVFMKNINDHNLCIAPLTLTTSRCAELRILATELSIADPKYTVLCHKNFVF